MTTDHLNENMSFDDIDEMLKPVTEIDLSNQHSDALEHLQDQLGLIAHLVGIHIDEKTADRRTETMNTNTENAIPTLTLQEEDFGSYNALENVPEDYRPQIDPVTRQIFRELAYDLMALGDGIKIENGSPDLWFSAQVPCNVLCEVLQDVFPPIADRARILGDKPMEEPASPQAPVTYRYRPGDFTRALREGLRHENIVDDIEEIMFGLLFHRDDHSHDMARDLLADLVNALDKTE